MELPFTELPNMMLAFLAADNISGSNIQGKSRYATYVASYSNSNRAD